MTMTSIATDWKISIAPANARAPRMLRRLAALLRFRNYPGQRRLRSAAAMRWIDDFVRHQR